MDLWSENWISERQMTVKISNPGHVGKGEASLRVRYARDGEKSLCTTKVMGGGEIDIFRG